MGRGRAASGCDLLGKKPEMGPPRGLEGVCKTTMDHGTGRTGRG